MDFDQWFRSSDGSNEPLIKTKMKLHANGKRSQIHFLRPPLLLQGLSLLVVVMVGLFFVWGMESGFLVLVLILMPEICLVITFLGIVIQLA